MIIVLLAFTILTYTEASKLIKQGYWRELIFFSVMMVIAFGMSILFVMDIPIFNPVKFMEYVVRDVFHLNYR